MKITKYAFHLGVKKGLDPGPGPGKILGITPHAGFETDEGLQVSQELVLIEHF